MKPANKQWQGGKVAEWPLRHFATSPLLFGHCRGQALIEFAIVGSMALMALALFIQIGLRVNFQQEIEQQAFRRALATAKAEDFFESQTIQYQLFRDRRIPNPALGFLVVPRASTQASATVTWGEWLTYLADDRDSQPRIITQLNDQVKEFRSEDLKRQRPDGSPCDDLEDDECRALPLVSRIQRNAQHTGEIRQSNTASTLEATATETTTMTLNTNNNDTISSTLTTPTRFDWAGGSQ